MIRDIDSSEHGKDFVGLERKGRLIQSREVEQPMIRRREFLGGVAGVATGVACGSLSRVHGQQSDSSGRVVIEEIDAAHDVFQYLQRQHGRFDQTAYQKILGAANAYKEGDASLGVAANDDRSRRNAQRLLANTSLADIDAHAIYPDELSQFNARSLPDASKRMSARWTLGRLLRFLLRSDEAAIKARMAELSSQVIGCVVKLMSNDELIALGAKVFNPLPESDIGAKGFLGARIQPNSPTDNVDDIRWQVLSGFSYAVGDVLLGTNPVSSDPESVVAIQRTLQELLDVFEIGDAMPHCVLSHIDVQAQAEAMDPGCTELWFQSIAGVDAANGTFDISIEKMKRHAAARSGRYGLYFETGQGADFTNGHGSGFDMVLHEARKYGFARSLTREVGAAQKKAGNRARPWVHLNDVAGFIGPEVFRTRDQLVRCCLEDIVMGKLHGLCIGLDVCSTLHMDVSLDDLDWCLDQIVPANPAYLMALPTKIDPMLGYLTTGFQDHVRLREKFGLRVSGRMWRFFQRLGVIDAAGDPTAHFGDPVWVYLKYCRAKQDARSDAQIRQEGLSRIAEVRDRGVFIAAGHGEKHSDLAPQLDADIRRIYADSKESIWKELDSEFVESTPDVVPLKTNSVDREDYILHPVSGEQLGAESNRRLASLKSAHADRYDVQIIISDGLNAHAVMDEGHLQPFLRRLRKQLELNRFQPSPDNLMVRSGRVRVGYRIGEVMFAGRTGTPAILHVIGERPGTGHHTFSVYITAPSGGVWGQPGKVDHNITKVVSGIARTALDPVLGADASVKLLMSLRQ